MHLATLVHVSDLHLGDVAGDGAPVHSALARALVSKLPRFDGLFGHSRPALRRLAEFWKWICEREDNVYLVVTGDLTAYGHGRQFDMATTYLGDELVPPRGNHVGLHVTDWAQRAVTGNHDRWPGRPVIFGWNSRVGQMFTYPAVSRLPLPNGQALRFIRIDTDRNVQAVGRNRLFARGSFHSELTALTDAHEGPQPGDFSVLLLHHAPSYRGEYLEVVEGSRGDLHPFLIEQDAAVMLCGHVHAPRVSTFRARHGDISHEVLEARCGTTTQLDRLPFGWRDRHGRRPRRKLAENTLLVHRLESEGADARWSVETYRRHPDGFKPWPQGPARTMPVRAQR
jgi:calcineurin-like phosphoesterase family protein